MSALSSPQWAISMPRMARVVASIFLVLLLALAGGLARADPLARCKAAVAAERPWIETLPTDPDALVARARAFGRRARALRDCSRVHFEDAQAFAAFARAFQTWGGAWQTRTYARWARDSLANALSRAATDMDRAYDALRDARRLSAR